MSQESASAKAAEAVDPQAPAVQLRRKAMRERLDFLEDEEIMDLFDRTMLWETLRVHSGQRDDWAVQEAYKLLKDFGMVRVLANVEGASVEIVEEGKS